MTPPKKKLPQLNNSVTAIDTHCHLDMSAYESDITQVLKTASQNGVKQVITIGIDLPSSNKAVELAHRFSNVKATIGIHPHETESGNESTYNKLISLHENNRDMIVGYGEIGLDYAKQYAPIDTQKNQFQYQLGLARELNLPIVIHDRDAHDDTLHLLHKNGPYPAGGVMHCFSGDLKLADKILGMGFYISIPGIVTFKNAKILQHVAAKIPLESMLIETDGPFLAPVPMRGKRNEPSYVLYTAQKIAELRDISLEEVATSTTLNAQKLFNLNIDQ